MGPRLDDTTLGTLDLVNFSGIGTFNNIVLPINLRAAHYIVERRVSYQLRMVGGIATNIVQNAMMHSLSKVDVDSVARLSTAAKSTNDYAVRASSVLTIMLVLTLRCTYVGDAEDFDKIRAACSCSDIENLPTIKASRMLQTRRHVAAGSRPIGNSESQTYEARS